MQNTDEKKNYAALRFSSTYGQTGANIKLAVNREEIIKWFQDMTPDAKGIVRVCICPRKTPSPANAFTLFQDTWKPDASRATAAPRPTAQPAAKPLTPAETDDIPF